MRFANSGGKLSCVRPKDCFCASLERKSVLANAPTGQLGIAGESKLGGSCHFFGNICTLFAFPGILVLKPSAPAALRSPRQQQALSFPALFGAASHMQLTACVFDHTLLGPLAT